MEHKCDDEHCETCWPKCPEPQKDEAQKCETHTVQFICGGCGFLVSAKQTQSRASYLAFEIDRCAICDLRAKQGEVQGAVAAMQEFRSRPDAPKLGPDFSIEEARKGIDWPTKEEIVQKARELALNRSGPGYDSECSEVAIRMASWLRERIKGKV